MKMLNIWRLSYDLANKANNLPLLQSSPESTIASFKAKMEYILGLNIAHFKALPIVRTRNGNGLSVSLGYVFVQVLNSGTLHLVFRFLVQHAHSPHKLVLWVQP